MRYRIDSSDRTHLAVCACTWRSPVYVGRAGKLAAREALVRHERRAHPGDSDARIGLYRATHQRPRRTCR